MEMDFIGGCLLGVVAGLFTGYLRIMFLWALQDQQERKLREERWQAIQEAQALLQKKGEALLRDFEEMRRGLDYYQR
ncbi:hypothetical protein ACJJJB_00160 (plasmid) [Microbulbifer sp. ANSA001]|uniref:hypothetical protein n=1 Tax=Microbulbifer sp. ANSA001 TaxID=3243358 RepID=UPI00404373C1